MLAAVMLVVVMVLVLGKLSGLDQLLEVGTVVLGRPNTLGAALKWANRTKVNGTSSKFDRTSHEGQFVKYHKLSSVQ